MVWLAVSVCIKANSSNYNPTSLLRFAAVELPQVLVDGVVLGGENDLQELEEDGDLGTPHLLNHEP